MTGEGVVLDDDDIVVDDRGGESDPGGVDGLEQEVEIAADYVVGLLDIADIDGDIEEDIEGERGMVRVVGTGLAALVGPQGEVLEALQELARLAVTRETGERSRVLLDIGGYRAARRDRALAEAAEAISTVQHGGGSVRLSPMTAFERKAVHDAVAAAGLTSNSEGVEPNRCVVVLAP